MLKKLPLYNGSVLLESLLSLAIVCLVIGTFSVTIVDLLKQSQRREQQLFMKRFAYEAIKEYELYGGVTSKTINFRQLDYQIELVVLGNQVKRIEVSEGKEKFIVEK